MRKFAGQMPPQTRTARFLRACVVEMRMDMSPDFFGAAQKQAKLAR